MRVEHTSTSDSLNPIVLAEIDAAVGSGLRSTWNDVASEPLPPVFHLAAAQLIAPPTLVRSLTRWLLAHPLTPCLAPPLLVFAVIIFYVAKTLIGIDLFTGESILHFILLD